MKLTHKMVSLCAVFALLSAGAVFADDGFDFAGSSSSGTDASSADASSDTSSSSVSAVPAVTIGGTIKMDARAYLDKDDNHGEKTPTKVKPDGTLNINYSTDASEVEAKLNFSEDSIKTYNQDVLQEAVARVYVGNFIFEGGKEKLVWGKGDKLHVVDNFLATDYTDFIIPDYIDRRLGEPMFRAVYNAPSGAFRAEAVYTPMMTADRLASSGYWEPDQVTKLTTLVTNVEGAKVVAAQEAAKKAWSTYTASSTNANHDSYVAAEKAALTALNEASHFSSNDLLPNTNTIKYSQYGARITGTVGTLDWGLSYYLGHYKQPSANMSAYLASYVANNGTSYVNPSLDYDRLQVFGLEAAKAFGRLNTRLEVAYNMTEDFDGDDPWVHNNSVSWVPGFDMDLPIHNVNINIQEIGTYILKGDKIEDNDKLYSNRDVDHDAKDRHTNNKLAVDLTDTFLHENLKFDILGTWGIERGDFILQPKMTYTVKTGWDLILSGMWIYCKDENSEFYAWRHNSFAQAGVKYMF